MDPSTPKARIQLNQAQFTELERRAAAKGGFFADLLVQAKKFNGLTSKQIEKARLGNLDTKKAITPNKEKLTQVLTHAKAIVDLLDESPGTNMPSPKSIVKRSEKFEFTDVDLDGYETDPIVSSTPETPSKRKPEEAHEVSSAQKSKRARY